MAKTPTITVTGGTSEFEVFRQGAASVTLTALSALASNIAANGVILSGTVAAGLIAGEGLLFRTKTTSGYIDASAEPA
jgi:hypothetical protein